MVWFMNINLTDDRTTKFILCSSVRFNLRSYDNRSSGGVFRMPKERRMRGGGGVNPAARECATVRQTRRSFRALRTTRTTREKSG